MLLDKPSPLGVSSAAVARAELMLSSSRSEAVSNPSCSSSLVSEARGESFSSEVSGARMRSEPGGEIGRNLGPLAAERETGSAAESIGRAKMLASYRQWHMAKQQKIERKGVRNGGKVGSFRAISLETT